MVRERPSYKQAEKFKVESTKVKELAGQVLELIVNNPGKIIFPEATVVEIPDQQDLTKSASVDLSKIDAQSLATELNTRAHNVSNNEESRKIKMALHQFKNALEKVLSETKTEEPSAPVEVKEPIVPPPEPKVEAPTPLPVKEKKKKADQAKEKNEVEKIGLNIKNRLKQLDSIIKGVPEDDERRIVLEKIQYHAMLLRRIDEKMKEREDFGSEAKLYLQEVKDEVHLLEKDVEKIKEDLNSLIRKNGDLLDKYYQRLLAHPVFLAKHAAEVPPEFLPILNNPDTASAVSLYIEERLGDIESKEAATLDFAVGHFSRTNFKTVIDKLVKSVRLLVNKMDLSIT